MYKIQLFDKFADAGYKTFNLKNYSIKDEQDDPDGILVHSHPLHDVEFGKNLKSIVRIGTGVNTIPVDKLTKMGVAVFNCPGGNSNAVKELTIAAMLLAARDIRGSMEWVKENKGDELINKSMEKAKGAFAGTEIMGKTLGIIGLGAIGALVAGAAGALGMHVVAVEPSAATVERNKHLCPNDLEVVLYDELYARADYISVHVPLLDATRGMINKDAFAKMKDGVILINCARDAIVNDDDLKEAIAAGKVRRYVTDFPNYKTANMDGVVAISHLGASTEEAEDNCAKMAVDEMRNYLENGHIVLAHISGKLRQNFIRILPFTHHFVGVI